MTLLVIRGSAVPPLPAATGVGTAALREEVICLSHQRVCGQAAGTQTPSEAQASGTERSWGRSQQPLQPLTRLGAPALPPPAARPHPPAWRRPSLRPGAASPAGPGAAGAAWPWPWDVCPARRREQAGNFATGPAVRLPRTGPAPGRCRAAPSPSPPPAAPLGDGFPPDLPQLRPPRVRAAPVGLSPRLPGPPAAGLLRAFSKRPRTAGKRRGGKTPIFIALIAPRVMVSNSEPQFPRLKSGGYNGIYPSGFARVDDIVTCNALRTALMSLSS